MSTLQDLLRMGGASSPVYDPDDIDSISDDDSGDYDPSANMVATTTQPVATTTTRSTRWGPPLKPVVVVAAEAVTKPSINKPFIHPSRLTQVAFAVDTRMGDASSPSDGNDSTSDDGSDDYDPTASVVATTTVPVATTPTPTPVAVPVASEAVTTPPINKPFIHPSRLAQVSFVVDTPTATTQPRESLPLTVQPPPHPQALHYAPPAPRMSKPMYPQTPTMVPAATPQVGDYARRAPSMDLDHYVEPRQFHRRDVPRDDGDNHRRRETVRNARKEQNDLPIVGHFVCPKCRKSWTSRSQQAKKKPFQCDGDQCGELVWAVEAVSGEQQREAQKVMVARRNDQWSNLLFAGRSS